MLRQITEHRCVIGSKWFQLGDMKHGMHLSGRWQFQLVSDITNFHWHGVGAKLLESQLRTRSITHQMLKHRAEA